MFARRTILAALAAAATPGFALAQAFPARPLRMLVGFGAGGITDITARMIADALGQSLGQNVVVDNKSGAGGNIATAELARASPDGYTLMLASPGQMVVNPLTMKSVGFDPKTKFTLIGLTNTSPFVLVVPANSPFKSVQDLVAWGKQNPGALSFGSPGIGTTMHIGGEMLKAMAGFEATHIPYRGGAQASGDLIAGRVKFMIDSLGQVSSFLDSGQLKVIAVASGERMARFPGVPTLGEAYPDLELSSWLGLVGPPQMPADVVARLSAALQLALKSPKVIDVVEKRGSNVGDGKPATFAEHLDKERQRVLRTVVKAGLQLD